MDLPLNILTKEEYFSSVNRQVGSSFRYILRTVATQWGFRHSSSSMFTFFAPKKKNTITTCNLMNTDVDVKTTGLNWSESKPTVWRVFTWCHGSYIGLPKQWDGGMLLYQTNPVAVQLFSYGNTFFCHVVVPNQSCGSSTLFLCKHFLLSCCCTKPILCEFNSFLM